MSRMLRSQVPLDRDGSYWCLLKAQTDPLKADIRREKAKSSALRQNLLDEERKRQNDRQTMKKIRQERDNLKKELANRDADMEKKATAQVNESSVTLKRKMMDQNIDLESARHDLKTADSTITKQEKVIKKLRLDLKLSKATLQQSEVEKAFWLDEYSKADVDRRALEEKCDGLQQELYDKQMDIGNLKADLAAVVANSDTSINCAVCLEKKHELSDGLSTLTCGHGFCSACINLWWNANRARNPNSKVECPKCRALISSPPTKVYIFDN